MSIRPSAPPNRSSYFSYMIPLQFKYRVGTGRNGHSRQPLRNRSGIRGLKSRDIPEHPGFARAAGSDQLVRIHPARNLVGTPQKALPKLWNSILFRQLPGIPIQPHDRKGILDDDSRPVPEFTALLQSFTHRLDFAQQLAELFHLPSDSCFTLLQQRLQGLIFMQVSAVFESLNRVQADPERAQPHDPPQHAELLEPVIAVAVVLSDGKRTEQADGIVMAKRLSDTSKMPAICLIVSMALTSIQ